MGFRKQFSVSRSAILGFESVRVLAFAKAAFFPFHCTRVPIYCHVIKINPARLLYARTRMRANQMNQRGTLDMTHATPSTPLLASGFPSHSLPGIGGWQTRMIRGFRSVNEPPLSGRSDNERAARTITRDHPLSPSSVREVTLDPSDPFHRTLVSRLYFCLEIRSCWRRKCPRSAKDTRVDTEFKGDARSPENRPNERVNIKEAESKSAVKSDKQKKSARKMDRSIDDRGGAEKRVASEEPKRQRSETTTSST
jgi:hypothetical protein